MSWEFVFRKSVWCAMISKLLHFVFGVKIRRVDLMVQGQMLDALLKTSATAILTTEYFWVIMFIVKQLTIRLLTLKDELHCSVLIQNKLAWNCMKIQNKTLFYPIVANSQNVMTCKISLWPATTLATGACLVLATKTISGHLDSITF